MSAPLAGQDKAPLATVARDFLPANQEWEFPRGRVNKKFFLDEQWEINKDRYDEQYLKFDCCNVEKGGETDFRELNIKIKPKKGKIIVFQNCLNDNKTPHPDSIHAGLPVLEGEKYAFNLWFHEKYYRK